MMNKQCENEKSLSLSHESSIGVAKRKVNNLDLSNDESLSKREKKHRRHEMTEEERRSERRSANRKSAFESRHRRKVLIEELQDTVQNLTKENSSIRKELEELRMKAEDLMRENLQLRIQQQLACNLSSASASLPLSTTSRNSAAMSIAPNAASLSMTSNTIPLPLSVPSHRSSLWRIPDGMNANVPMSMPPSLDQFISLRGGVHSLIRQTSERNATSHNDLTAEYLRSLYEGNDPTR